jgi:exo-beta-1,3-glucanase (GH17 family)
MTSRKLSHTIAVMTLLILLLGCSDNTSTLAPTSSLIAPTTAATLNPTKLSSVEPCQAGETLLDSLTTCRNWITFAPPSPFNPHTNTYPSEEQLKRALQTLFNDGWRGLITYSMEGNLKDVPRLAKQIGFKRVIAGIYWYNQASLTSERQAALNAPQDSIDGFLLGNEGLQEKRYTFDALKNEIAKLKHDTGKPVVTSESYSKYVEVAELINTGDWVFPNIHPWFANLKSIPLATQYVQDTYNKLKKAAPNRTIVIKETWWPTDSDPSATEAVQAKFFQELAAKGKNLKFVFGEAYDQSWKPGAESHFGLYTTTDQPKLTIINLKNTYSGNY